MLPAECHAAERADTRPEIEDKSDTSREYVTDKTALEDIQRANAQQTIDMLEHNLQEHGKQTGATEHVLCRTKTEKQQQGHLANNTCAWL